MFWTHKSKMLGPCLLWRSVWWKIKSERTLPKHETSAATARRLNYDGLFDCNLLSLISTQLNEISTPAELYWGGQVWEGRRETVNTERQEVIDMLAVSCVPPTLGKVWRLTTVIFKCYPPITSIITISPIILFNCISNTQTTDQSSNKCSNFRLVYPQSVNIRRVWDLVLIGIGEWYRPG